MLIDQNDSYISKYATKAEQQAPKFPELLKEVTQNMDPNGNAQSACQKLLNKMIGERTYSAQETAHLLLGIPLVRSSVSFQTLNLSPDGALRELRENNEGGDTTEAMNVDEPVQDRIMTGLSWLQR